MAAAIPPSYDPLRTLGASTGEVAQGPNKEIAVMSVFDNILEKLGLRKRSKVSPPTTTQQPTAKPAPQGSAAQRGSTAQGSARGPESSAPQASRAPSESARASATAGSSAATAAATAPVNVTGYLEALAAKSSERLNWRTSIVDLLKLLDIESSLASRRDLADELGAPADLKDGSAEMNTWLHRTVLQRIADNGGNVPKELLD